MVCVKAEYWEYFLVETLVKTLEWLTVYHMVVTWG